MRFAFWLGLGLLFIVGINGCTTQMRPQSKYGRYRSMIKLNPENFQVVGTVSAEASCPHLLWINIPKPLLNMLNLPAIPLITFPLGNKDLHHQAMQDLNNHAKIQDKSRVLHNLKVEGTLANYLGLFAISRISIRAEVLEFKQLESNIYRQRGMIPEDDRGSTRILHDAPADASY